MAVPKLGWSNRWESCSLINSFNSGFFSIVLLALVETDYKFLSMLDFKVVQVMVECLKI